MKDTLLGMALLVGILGFSFVVTQLFAGKMYNRCERCGSLNAKRRWHCRVCGEAISS